MKRQDKRARDEIRGNQSANHSEALAHSLAIYNMTQIGSWRTGMIKGGAIKSQSGAKKTLIISYNGVPSALCIYQPCNQIATKSNATATRLWLGEHFFLFFVRCLGIEPVA